MVWAQTHSIPSRSSHLMRDTLRCSGGKQITTNRTFSTRLVTNPVEKVPLDFSHKVYLVGLDTLHTLYCDTGICKHDVNPNHLLCMIQHPRDV